MSFRSVFVAASALLATANAHIILKSPVPYSADKIDNSPITAEQYPCKTQNGFTVSTMNQMKVGESQQVEFTGSAVHGGGSCQLSYTTDTTPTKDSVFKVIKSIEGGCPGVDGVKSFDFTLPDSIPNGKGSFAWSWFSKLSGQPELYMNCAPIEVSGGASDASGLDALPDMLIANIASTTCKSPTNKAVKFPSPGSEVQDGGTNDTEAPTGECGATGGGSDTPAASSGAAAPSSAPTSAAGSEPSSAPSASAPAATPTATGGGGVFAPGASSAAAQSTTLATVTSAASPPATGTAAPATPTGSPSGGEGSSCSENGAIVCNGTDQFGLCNNGSIVWQTVAAGTTCSNGAITKRGYNGRIARPRRSN